MGVSTGDAAGEGVEDGIVCATLRKNSSMYWREAGSYYKFVRQSKQIRSMEGTVHLQGTHLRGKNLYVHRVEGHWERAKGEQIRGV